MEPFQRFSDVQRPDWLAFVLLLILTILALVRTFGRERLRLIASSVLRPRVSRQEVREKTDISDIGFIGLWSISILSIGLFVYQEMAARNADPFDLSPFFTYLTFCGCLAGYFLARALFIKVSMFFIGSDMGGNEYMYNTFMLFSITGVAMIPLVIYRAYVQYGSNIVWMIGIGIIILTFLYQWVRGWIIAGANGARPIYIILYFCVLEILPIAILARFVFGATIGR